ncbi:hypothetical protein EXU48_07430 [Occultella glacieicola]|uniref:Transcriptional regulator, AbiEi antitoxin, Type IV TA system n=1 Tax=Occultella glacieicola TaxID=2518684 RepID=A0ABY2E9W1_9MICO|nr:hypothetical protein [Occultella glacieicola]TDE96060.1 hypothetical protein EXU48_07430 [Occultella glacieicola]
MSDDVPVPPNLPRTFLTGELTASVRARLLAEGRLTQVRTGAFAIVDPNAPRWRRNRANGLGRCVAAARVLSRDHVFGHTSAALLHGCAYWRIDEKVHLFQDGNPSPRHTKDLFRHVGVIPEPERTVVNGLPVTTLERTILDCARILHPRDALIVVDSALRILVRPDREDRPGTDRRTAQVRDGLLERLEQPDMRRGRRQARALIALADPYAESAGESAVRWLALARGLPVPVCQCPVPAEDKTYYTDMAWYLNVTRSDGSERLVTIHTEFDGLLKYLGAGPDAARVVSEEKVREDRIRATGAEVVRVIWDDLSRPGRVFDRITQFLPVGSVHALRARAELFRP